MGGDTSETARVDSGDVAAAIRANAFHALAKAFDRPDNWPSAIGDLLLEAFAACDGTLFDIAREMAEESVDNEALSIAHARLFLGPFAVQAAPWASFYLDAEQQLMGPVSRCAAQAYAEAGLAPRAGVNEAPDHVTHELEFMYYLAFLEATTDDPVWRRRQQRFWDDHLHPWLPKFAGSLEEAAGDTRFYSLLGRLTGEFCDWQNRQLAAGRDAPRRE